MPDIRQTIAVVAYPDLTALDLVGPLQVLVELSRIEPRFDVKVVAATGAPMATDVGLRLAPATTFDQLPHPDILVVPGGRRGTLRALTDPAIRDYVREAARSAEIVASVCTGSLILASLGLLDGRRATTNWAFRGVLERLGARYERRRWIHDGNLVMSAGVSAGIDMALYLVSVLADEATARQVQQAIDYDPEPPFGRIEWDHLPLLARIVRGALTVAAPFISMRPKRMTRSATRAASVARRTL